MPSVQARAKDLWAVFSFGLCIAFLSVVFSFLILPWVNYPWWMIVRRCVSIAAIVTLVIFVRGLEHRSLRSYGFPRHSCSTRLFLSGVWLGLAALGMLLVSGLITGACRIEVTSDHLRLWRTVIGFFPIAFLVSILEELVFRGFILQHLLSYSKTIGLVISSSLYSLVHLKHLNIELSTWLELGGLFLLGFILGLSYLRTRQLYFAMGLHAILAYGSRINKLLVEFPNPSISWLVGTHRLVNGLAGWTMLLLLGVIIVSWSRLRQQGGLHGT